MSAAGDEPDPMELEEDDLFGDDDEEQQEEAAVSKARELDDEDLDSGDDENRHDRAGDSEKPEDDGPMADVKTVQAMLYRHNIPTPSDGQVHTLQIPKFLSVAERPYNPATYRIPTVDHHSHTKSENFSACDTAATTIRYRKNPTTGKLESNTLLYRWSDGSVTIQVGDQHYEVEAKQLSQPKTAKYKPEFDSSTYLASAHLGEKSQILQVVSHLTNQLTVRPNKDLEDDALEKLQISMAAATRGRNAGNSKKNMVETTQDPELQRKQAELASKERDRQQRRREAASQRATQQAGRGRIAAGGLSIGELEGRSSVKKAPKRGPRKSRYDEDTDDERPKGRGNQDEYDREDDFLASSDDEGEADEPEEEEEDEDMLDDDSEKAKPKSKRGNNAREEDSDVDADGEVDPDAAAPEASSHRPKRRNIIEDEDDED